MSDNDAGGFRPWERKALRALIESGGGGGLLHQATVLADNDQLLAVTASAIEIVEAPGADILLVPVIVLAHFDTRGGAFTNIDAEAQAYITVGSGVASEVVTDLTPLSGIGRAGYVFRCTPTGWDTDLGAMLAYATTLTDLANGALSFALYNGSAGPIANGHAGNSLRLSALYAAVNLATGAFI